MEILPKEFQDRMKTLLGKEYPSFLASYEEPRRYGLRVNTLKITVEEFRRIAPFHLTPIHWISSGFFYEKDDVPSRHPFYYAGLYYLQEPSAMTPAQVLPVTPGDRVLDLCAAPGGKATALAEKLQGQGLLVANDISASRAKALLKNLEMFGVTNSLVTSTAPFQLSDQFHEFFDKILVDAPCSGEGMFRKDPASAKEWSLSKVYACAKKQKEIVRHAVSMLRPGGMMLYSTCTFSPEEDEQVIAYILENYPDMDLLSIPMAAGFENGRPELSKEDWQETIQDRSIPDKNIPDGRADLTSTNQISDRLADLKKCVRIFPHKMPGEGHFLALLKKRENVTETVQTENAKEQKHKKNRKKQGFAAISKHDPAETAFVTTFLKEFYPVHSEDSYLEDSYSGRPHSDSLHSDELHSDMPHFDASCADRFYFDEADIAEQIEFHGSYVYYIPKALKLLRASRNQREIQVLRCGLYLGEVQKERFEPSQALAMALRRERDPDTKRLNFDYADERISRYLRGETIEITESIAENGWRLICVNGYPLGWGKLVNGTLKNKYLPGWRVR
ncbi:MAG: RsmB/NOP family class I SAM-dependent RNA methyltransferase [Clostridiales bacterium]|nr:RsmB/NOP family class I SAM-dependent RNA methyltransferase [Clostridiales bacterium]